MAKRVFVFIIVGSALLIAFGVFLEETSWNPFNYVRITEVDYKAVVVDEPGSYGKVRVTERLTFEAHAASSDNLFWELWRVLPEEYVDGVFIEYNVISVKQVFDDGRPPVIFTEAPKLYWYDRDFINTADGLGPGKWFHSQGPYDGHYNFECVLIYVDGLYRETVIFEIEYEMYNATMRYGDCSELYISIYSEDTVNFLRNFKGQILFPLDIMPRTGNYDVFTLGTNSHGFPFTESASLNPGYHTFSFELDKSMLRFRPYNQYIEFALISFGEDKHIFTQHASVNYHFNFNVLDNLKHEQAEYEALPGRFFVTKIILLVILSAGAAAAVFSTLNSDKSLRKKHSFFRPAEHIQFFRDIPSDLDPNFASALVFCKHKTTNEVKDGYAAVLLDLVRKGYIELVQISPSRGWNPNNVRLMIRYHPESPVLFCTECGKPAVPGNTFCVDCGKLYNEDNPAKIFKPLTQTEELYFNLILRHSNNPNGVTMNNFQEMVKADFEYTNQFLIQVKQAITSIGVTLGYYQKFDYRKPAENVRSSAVTYCFFGILFTVVANFISFRTRLDLVFGAFFIIGIAFIACSVYLFVVSKKYILLTQFGENEYEKWRGLYNFLDSETLMNERTVIDLVLWEQYLVYATAFGISEKVIKALKIRCTEVYLNASPVLRNPYYRTRTFYHAGRSFRTATRTASHTARSGSHGGGGFGGGYGGSGRGGGGGGGGH